MPNRIGLTDGRERLLDAASELMCAKDFHDFSVREVADQAGLNVSLIKYYFGSKDGLLLTVLMRDVESSMTEYQRIAASDASATDKLREYMTEIINSVSTFPYLFSLCFAILREFAEGDARELAGEVLRPMYDQVVAILEEGMNSGEFRRIDLLTAFVMIQGVCVNMFSSQASFTFVYGEEPDYKGRQAAFTRDAVEFVLMALRPVSQPSHAC